MGTGEVWDFPHRGQSSICRLGEFPIASEAAEVTRTSSAPSTVVWFCSPFPRGHAAVVRRSQTTAPTGRAFLVSRKCVSRTSNPAALRRSCSSGAGQR